MRLRDVLLVALLVAGAGLAAAAPRTLHAADRETVALDAPWSFVTATAAGPPEAVLGGIPGLVAAYRWDARAAAFEVWRPAGPPFLNTLAAIAPADALWLRLAAPTAWTRPVLTGARTVLVPDGWSTIAWTGPAAPAPEVARTLGADRIVAFVAGEFASFAPARPAALNGLHTVERGQALWVYAQGSRTRDDPGRGGRRGVGRTRPGRTPPVVPRPAERWACLHRAADPGGLAQGRRARPCAGAGALARRRHRPAGSRTPSTACPPSSTTIPRWRAGCWPTARKRRSTPATCCCSTPSAR